MDVYIYHISIIDLILRALQNTINLILLAITLLTENQTGFVQPIISRTI